MRQSKSVLITPNAPGLPPTPPGRHFHIPALDGLRGIAILLVLVYHSAVIPFGPAPQSAGWLDRLVVVGVLSGWIGVDLFFVLSGFLITGILYDAKALPHYFRNFYARRILRIFPLYYAVLTVLLVILPNLPIIRHSFGQLNGDELWYWVYLSNIALAISHAEAPRRLDVFWSLAIEEQFYLVWPVIVLLFSRRRLLWLCGGLIVFAIGWRSGMLLLDAHPQSVYVLTPSRLDALAVGALVALAIRASESYKGLLRWLRPVVGVAILSLIVLAVWYGRFSPFLVGVQTIGYTALALLFGAWLVVIIGAPQSSAIVRRLEARWLRAFGRYSYALYLLHVPLMLALLQIVPGMDRILQTEGFTLLAWLVFGSIAISATFGLSWLSWHLFEKRFLALKRFFEYGPGTEGDLPRRPRPEATALQDGQGAPSG